jgi:hypothetical protein
VAIKRAIDSRQSDILQGWVKDISTGGICFTSQENFTVGDTFEFSVTFPTAGVQEAEVFVQAQAMAVRVGQEPGNSNQRSYVAAVIEGFKIIRTKASES